MEDIPEAQEALEGLLSAAGRFSLILQRARAEEARLQARRLLDYTAKGGSAAKWWRSKDFVPDMRDAIERELAELRRGRAQ